MRREKSLRIGVHHANAVVWEPVYRTHLRHLRRRGGGEVSGNVVVVVVFSVSARARGACACARVRGCLLLLLLPRRGVELAPSRRRISRRRRNRPRLSRPRRSPRRRHRTTTTTDDDASTSSASCTHASRGSFAAAAAPVAAPFASPTRSRASPKNISRAIGDPALARRARGRALAIFQKVARTDNSAGGTREGSRLDRDVLLRLLSRARRPAPTPRSGGSSRCTGSPTTPARG